MSFLVSLVIGVVIFVVLLKLAFGLIAFLIGLAAAVLIYFAAEKLIGRGR